MIILTSKNYFNTRSFKRWIYPDAAATKVKNQMEKYWQGNYRTRWEKESKAERK